MPTKAWRLSHVDQVRRTRREWYYRNTAHAKAEIKRWHQETAAWFQEFKAALKCIRCGENDSVCLDFHHRNPDEKDFPVSRMMKHSKQRIMDEVAKCDVLCSNCHRKFHSRGVADWNAAVSKTVA